MRVVLLLVLVAFAGCADAPTNARTDNLTIHVGANGPFTVLVPLPEDTLTTSADWLAAFQGWLDNSHAAPNVTLSLRPENAGIMLQIAGNGTSDIEARLARTPVCCGDTFIDGTWSNPGSARPLTGMTLPVHVEGNVMEVSIAYEATNCNGPECEKISSRNQICNLSFVASIGGPNPGWGLMQVGRDDHQCSRAPST